MASTIAKVTELDKEMRQKVKALEDERAKLPVFLREQRKSISDKTEKAAKEKIKARNEEVQNELKKAETETDIVFQKSIQDIENQYENKKNEWIEQIYKQCIDSFVGE